MPGKSPRHGEVKVVDTSALAALLFGEPRGEEVAGRLEGFRAVAPTLLRYELASVCLKKLRLHPARRQALLAALSLLDAMDLQELGVPAAEIVALARRKKLTVYDAAYLWLARALKAELVTLDEKLARA